MRKHYSRLKLEELDPTTHDIRPLIGMFIAQSVHEFAEFMPRVFDLPKDLQQAPAGGRAGRRAAG